MGINNGGLDVPRGTEGCSESLSMPFTLDDKTLIVANHSGGKDSQAMLIKLLEVAPSSQILVVHASLGEMEWPGALELAQEQAEKATLDFVVARAKKTFLEMVLHRFKTRPGVPSWPSASTRQCTSDLKRGPIQREVRRYAKAHGYTRVINCLGLRASESPARAKKSSFVRSEKNCTKTREWFDWLPIHALSTEQVFKTIREAGQKPHYAYEIGNDRLSCTFCILASKKDLRIGRLMRPDLFAQYDAVEKTTGYTMHQSRIPLAQLTADDLEVAA